MKRILLAFALLCAPLSAQWADFTSSTGSSVLVGAMNGKISGRVGTTLPATCTQGFDRFLLTTTSPATNHYCDATNHWTPVPFQLGFTPLNPANNLSELANFATARANMGLGTAAVQNVGFFAQTANNGSDFANVATVRTNLGLGSAALQANPLTTAGDLLVAGASGVFSRLATPGNGTWCPTWTSGVITWGLCPGAGGGITGLNGLSVATQTFAFGSAGTTPNAVSSGSVHTFNYPLASTSGVTAGLIPNSFYNTIVNTSGSYTDPGWMAFTWAGGRLSGITPPSNGGTGANNTVGAAGHHLRSNGAGAYVDSAILAGDIPALTAHCTMSISGSGVVFDALNCPAAQTTATTVSGNPAITVTANAGISNGQSVSGTGIPGGTTVSSVSGTTITLSANATASASGVAVVFGTVAGHYNYFEFTLAANVTASSTANTVDGAGYTFRGIQNGSTAFTFTSPANWVDPPSISPILGNYVVFSASYDATSTNMTARAARGNDGFSRLPVMSAIPSCPPGGANTTFASFDPTSNVPQWETSAGSNPCVTPRTDGTAIVAVLSSAGQANKWVQKIDHTGVQTLAQPAFSNLSGVCTIAQGCTGQGTANAGFNALSPMTSAGDMVYGGASGAGTRLAPGSSRQVLLGGTTPLWGDMRDVKIVPFAACNNGTAGGAVSFATSTWTPTCRAGTNNLQGSLQAIPSTGAALQLLAELPADWDTASQPFIRIAYGSGANTSGTVIWTISSACSKADGSITDDPAFNAESAFASQTMAVANRTWAQTGQFTAMTSGNNCIAGSFVIIKVAVSGTASANINAYNAVLTIPTLPNAGQAN